MCKSIIREVVYYDSRKSYYDTRFPLLQNCWVDNVNVKIYGDKIACVVLIDEATTPTNLETFGVNLLGCLKDWGYDTRYISTPVEIFSGLMKDMDLLGKYQMNYAIQQTEEYLTDCVKACDKSICSLICIEPREGSLSNFVKTLTPTDETIYVPKLVVGTIWNGVYDIYTGIVDYDVKEYLQKLLDMNYGFLQFTDGTNLTQGLCNYIGDDILNKLWRDK